MSSSSNGASTASGGTSIGVAVGVPILIIAGTALIILSLVLAFLYYRSRQRRTDIDAKGVYAPLPLEDSGSASPPRLPHKTVPYGPPPTISLADPPNPNMQFTMATQLMDPSKTGQRYPFMDQHKQPEGRNLRDTRPLNKRTKKKGNHKHGHNRHGILKSASVDTSSDVSDQSSSGRSSEVRPRSRHSPLPSSHSPSEHEDGSQPMELYLTLSHHEDSVQFVVNIDRVVSLPTRPGDGALVDPYVRLFLIPKLAGLAQRKAVTTATQRGTLCPIFNEDIVYESVSREELINSSLTVDVMDSLPHGKHRLLGQALVQLASLNFAEGEAAMKLSLSTPEVSVCTCMRVVKQTDIAMKLSLSTPEVSVCTYMRVVKQTESYGENVKCSLALLSSQYFGSFILIVKPNQDS